MPNLCNSIIKSFKCAIFFADQEVVRDIFECKERSLRVDKLFKALETSEHPKCFEIFRQALESSGNESNHVFKLIAYFSFLSKPAFGLI